MLLSQIRSQARKDTETRRENVNGIGLWTTTERQKKKKQKKEEQHTDRKASKSSQPLQEVELQSTNPEPVKREVRISL